MAEIVWKDNRKLYFNELSEMFERRDAVFFDQMGWDREAAGIEKGWDRDQFDDDNAIYLIQKNPLTGRLVAHCRFLLTERPHMMTEVWPHMCNGDEGIPTGPNILEFTRVCYDVDQMEPGKEFFQWVRGVFCTAVTEFCIDQGIEAMTYVLTEPHLESHKKNHLWPSTALGDPVYDRNLSVNLTARKGLTNPSVAERIRSKLLRTTEPVLFYKGPWETADIEIVRAA
ncbi:MAG: acyl-homoserine-lactone synthase [Pseudomonadota bacterium]